MVQRRDGSRDRDAAQYRPKPANLVYPKTAMEDFHMRAPLILPWLLLVLSGPSHAAEPKMTDSTPPAGKFYVVQPDGKSRPQDPVREGVAVRADKRLSGSGQADRQTTATAGAKARNGTGGRVSGASTTHITGTSAPPKPAHDEFAAFRCEQFGFYYTKDGRCVAPTTRIPATPARPRLPAGSPLEQPRP